MAVKVEDKGEFLTEYDIPEGQSIEFRVGGDVIAYMQRVGPAPDGHMYFDADQDNVDEITIDFEHALSGPQTITLTPGQRSEIKPVVSRHWKITAPRWE